MVLRRLVQTSPSLRDARHRHVLSSERGAPTMTIINITNTTELTNALTNAVDGDVLHFAAGDYTSVLITISDNRDLTFTSDNAAIDPSAWAPLSEVKLNRISSIGSVTVEGIHVHQTAISA